MTRLYRIYRGDKKSIYIIASSPTQAIDISALPGKDGKPFIVAKGAVVCVDVSDNPLFEETNLKELLETEEIGQIDFVDENSNELMWVFGFYIEEIIQIGPFISNQAAAEYALKENINLSSRIVRI